MGVVVQPTEAECSSTSGMFPAIKASYDMTTARFTKVRETCAKHAQAAFEKWAAKDPQASAEVAEPGAEEEAAAAKAAEEQAAAEEPASDKSE